MKSPVTILRILRVLCPLFGLLLLKQESQAQSPVLPARGFNIFVRNGASVSGSEVQGPVALGGNLTLAGQISVASQNAGTFKVGNTTIGLLIGEKVIYQSGNSLNVNSNAYVKIGDCTGSKIWYQDNNGANSNLQVTSGQYNGSPRIQLQTSANNLGTSETSNPVCEGSLIDFAAAFSQLANNSISLSTCTNSLQLLEPNGTPIYDYDNLTNQVRCTLSTGNNILNISGRSLNNIQQFKFEGSRPDANHYLIINIDAAGSFTFEGIKSSELGSGEGAYILYNFYNTTKLTIDAKDQVPGTIFAPFAEIVKSDKKNLIGQVIGETFTMTDGLIQYALFTANVSGCGGPCVLPNVPPIQGANSVCKSDYTTLTNSSTGGVWSSADITIATVDMAGRVKGVNAGTTQIKYTVTNDCGSTEVVQAITVNTAPSKPTITAGSSTDFCEGGSVLLTSSPAASYQWYRDGDKIPGATNSTYTATQEDRYSLIVANASGCKSVAANSVYVTTTQRPNTPEISARSSTNLCPGEDVQLFVDESDQHNSDEYHDNDDDNDDDNRHNYNYQWYKNGIIISAETDNYIIVSEAGSYTVIKTNSSACNSLVSNPVIVTVVLQNISPITGASQLCKGSNITLTNTTTGGIWSSSNTAVATIDASTGIVTGINAGITTISYTIASNGCSNAVNKSILVNGLPAITEIVGESNICIGSNTKLTNSTPSGVWSSSNTAVATVSNIGVVNGLTAGTTEIRYTLTNETNCSAFEKLVMTVNPVPVVLPIIAPKTQICQNETITLTNATGNGVWSSSNNRVATVNTEGVVTGVAVGNATISYTVTSNTLCNGNASIVITVNKSPETPTIDPSTETNICPGGYVVLMSNATSGNTWYKNGILISSGNGNQTYAATSEGIYSVSVTANGCESLQSAGTSIKKIENTIVPVISVNGPTNVCAGITPILTSSEPSSNQWYLNGVYIPSATSQTYSATQSGTYTAKTVKNGCSSASSNAVPIVINALPEIPGILMSGPTVFCLGDSVLLTAQPNSTVTAYQWYKNTIPISGATSQTYMARTSGEYTVTVISAEGCSRASDNIIKVQTNDPLSSATISAGGPTSFCNGGSVVLTSSSATGNHWYLNGVLISSNNGNTTYTARTAGTYTVIVTNSFSCNSLPSNGLVVTTNAVPDKPTITAGGPTTICAPLTVVLTSSSSSFNQWYKDGVLIPGATAQNITVSATGNYTVIVSNVNGCASSMSDGVVVTVNTGAQIPLIFPLTTTTFCAGGTVTLVSTSNAGNQWVKDGVDIPGATNYFYTATASGSYSVKSFNAANCVNGTSAAVVVTVNALPIVNAISGNNNVCINASTTLANTTTGGIWSSSNNVIATINTSGIVTGISSGTATISYSVTAGTGCVNSANLTMTVNNLPTVAAISGPKAVCVNKTITLSSATTGGIWSSNNTAIATVNATSGIVTGVASGTATISYSVTSVSGCVKTLNWDITVYGLPTVSPITGSNIICKETVTQLLNASSGGVWSSDNNAIAEVSSTGLVTGTGIGTTNIRYTVSNTNGCSNVSIFSITISDYPTIASINGPSSVCQGNSATLTNSTPAGVWSTQNTAIASINAATGIITGVSAGSTKVTYSVTNANGCTATSSRSSFHVFSVPAAPVISAGGPVSFCSGDSVVLTSTPDFTYQWYKDGVAISAATGQYYNVLQSGSYTIQTGNNHSCTSVISNAIIVNVNSIPATPVISAGGPINFCAGASVILTSTTASNYQWYQNDIAIDGATSSTYTATTNGTYTVITSNISGCKANVSNSIIINVNSVPTKPLINAQGPTSFCAGNNVVLETNSFIGNQWYLNGVVINGATGQTYTATLTGIYTLIRTNSAGCISLASDPITITVNSLPAVPNISAGGPLTFCSGGSVLLSSSATSGNQWYKNNLRISNATGQTYKATATGSYSVKNTNINGCSISSATTTVTVNANPFVSPITGDRSVCINTSSPLFNATAGGVWSSNNTTVATINSDGLLTGNSVGVASISYKITNANGCSSTAISAAIILASPALPEITADGPTTFCFGRDVFLTSSSATGNQWYRNSQLLVGETDQKLHVNEGGSYTVDVTNAVGCVSNGISSAMIVQVNPLPAKPVITAGSNTVFCQGNNVVLSSSAASGNQWYFNSDSILNATAVTYTASNQGNYSVQVTDANNCVSLISNELFVYALALPSTPLIKTDGPLTFCEGGQVVISSNNRFGNQWYRNGLLLVGETGANYTATTSGLYTVINTSYNGCSSAPSAAVSVTVNSLPVVNSITGTGNVCVNETRTYSNATTGGIWSSSNTAIATVNATTGMITGVRAGIASISYTVTNLNGCTAFVTKSIIVYPLATKPSISNNGSTNFCAGSSILLTCSFNYRYQWYKDAVLIPGANTRNYLASASGNYSVAVSNILGCFGPKSDGIEVLVNPIPATPTITPAGNNNICSGSSVTLISSASSGNQWYHDGVPLKGATSQRLNVSVAGIYTVNTTSVSGCISALSLGTTISLNSLPVVTNITGSKSVCSGNTTTLANATAGGVWSSNNTAICSVNSITGVVTGVTAGITTINYTVTNANGCSKTVSTLFKVSSIPEIPAVSTNTSTTFCAGESVDLISSSSSGNQWYLNGVVIAGATNQIYTASASGKYTVSVTSGSGCISNGSSDTTIVSVFALPTVGNITGNTILCVNNTTQLLNANAGGVWTSSNENVASITSTGLATGIAAGSAIIKYTITNANACVSQANTTLTVNALPDKPIISAGGNTVFCAGGSVLLTSSPAVTYQWYRNGTVIAGANANTYSAVSSGTYTVVVGNSNACLSIASTGMVVTVYELPATPLISSNGPTSFCSGKSVILSSNATSNNQWYLNNSAITDATSQSLSVLNTGTYKVIVTNANGCASSASNDIVVTVNSLPATPVISASGPITFCEGNNVILSSTAGQNYQWSSNNTAINNQNTQTITVVKSGSYFVNVFDANNCFSANSNIINVTVNSVPDKPNIITANATSFCIGDSAILKSSASSGNQWYKDGAIISGATNINYTAKQTGTYTVKITNSSSCISSASNGILITVNTKPVTPSITSGGPTNFCLGDSVILRSSSVSGNIWYQNGLILSGVTGNSYVTKISGNYSVMVKNSNGCTSASSPIIPVKVDTLPTIPSITTGGPSTFCTGGSVILTSTIGTTYQWFQNGISINGATSRSYTASNSGIYTVSVTNTNGCSSKSTSASTVYAIPLPSGTLLGNPIQYVCTGSFISISAKGGFRYQWYKDGLPLTAPTFNSILIIRNPGVYGVTLINAAGCETPISKTISVLRIQKPVVDYTYDSYCTNRSVNFQSTSDVSGSGPVIYTWTDGNFISKYPSSAPTYTFTKSGSYQVKLIVTPYFCQISADSVTKTVKIEDPTPGIRMAPVDVAYNDAVQLQARNFGNSYQWSPNLFLNNPTIPNPIITANAQQEYKINIGVPSGCSTIDTVLVRIHESNKIYLPTVFTPNGDGLNDKLYLNYVGIKQLKVFRIYNRWGKLMFETTNMNEAWDGSVYGVKQPMDSYTVVIEAIDKNGKLFRKQGTITLIR